MDVNFPAKQIGRIREGLNTRVSNVNLPGKVFEGRVVQVSPALDPTTRTFKATVRMENPDRSLKPGMFVKAEIVVERHENVVVIPKDVIISRRQEKNVFVVERGVAVERRITTGIENPNEAEVTDGLAENDRLVVKGFETLRNRATVKMTE
jgi:RND family efflux transporter MFP subunit